MGFQSPCHRVNQCNEMPVDGYMEVQIDFQSPCHRVNQCNGKCITTPLVDRDVLSVPLSSGQSV